MKNMIKYWFLMLFMAIMTCSLWGCGDITTGDEELDAAIVDMVVDGLGTAIDSYLGEDTEGNSTGDSIGISGEIELPLETSTATPEPTVTSTPKPTATSTPKPTATSTPKPTATPTPAIDEEGWYYSKKEVALYIHTYEKLPENFITKSEAQDLGWTGGTVENYKEGAAIGGDKFGNREGILPKKNGRQYYECDIDTKGKGSRGAKRIVFSNDGLIYYTDDHYESFTLLYGEE